MVRMFDKVRVLFTLLVMVSLCAVSLPQQARAEAESPVVSEQAAAITTPADGEILAGMVEIQARSSGTDRVEFSIKDSTGTNTTNLGRAMKQGTENWIFSWDTGYSQDGI